MERYEVDIVYIVREADVSSDLCEDGETLSRANKAKLQVFRRRLQIPRSREAWKCGYLHPTFDAAVAKGLRTACCALTLELSTLHSQPKAHPLPVTTPHRVREATKMSHPCGRLWLVQACFTLWPQ